MCLYDDITIIPFKYSVDGTCPATRLDWTPLVQLPVMDREWTQLSHLLLPARKNSSVRTRSQLKYSVLKVLLSLQ